MPQTVSSTLLGTFQSIARAASVCNANGTTSLDVLTVAHQLGVCPDIMKAVLRSVVTATSGDWPKMALKSWDASQAIFNVVPSNGAGAMQAQFDIITQLIHSTQR